MSAFVFLDTTPTALGPVANTDTKLLIYGLFQKGRVLAQDGYLVAENRVLRNQIQGRLRLTDAKRPGATVLSPFVFLDTTGTLKRGYWNHDPFCRGVLTIQA